MSEAWNIIVGLNTKFNLSHYSRPVATNTRVERLRPAYLCVEERLRPAYSCRGETEASLVCRGETEAGLLQLHV